MRILLTFTFVLFITTTGLGQIYLMNNTNNGNTITSCGSVVNPILVYDSGGANGNYSNNENYTITFCPNVAGQQMRISFSSWQIGGVGDVLTVFDGTTAGGFALGVFDNTTPPITVQATAANATGCITLQWVSNSSATAAGFAAEITCENPCQTVISELALSSPASVPATNGYIDICPGEQVTFVGQGNYPYNNTFYTQSDATSTFVWTIEGQQFTGSLVNHTFNNPGGSRVQLKITDGNGCESTNILNQRIRVAPDPYFDGTNVDLTTICPDDTINLEGVFIPTEEDFVVELSRGDSIRLPDVDGGVIQSHSTSLLVTDFFPGQSITNVNDITEICMNIEHSYMGDLGIEITCPNNQSILLHNQGGAGTYLGFPVENDDATPASQIVGTGIEYCWSASTTNPTLANASTNPLYTTLYNAPPGFPSNTINAGTYSPEQSFSSLVGCPLNGPWTITVTDYLNLDNGYIFGWGITFDQSLYPAVETYMPTDSLREWSTNSTIINNIGDTMITAAPTNPGNVAYIFSTTTNWGCTYDTIISVEVLPVTNPQCLDCDSIYSIIPMTDTVICETDSVSLNITPNSNVTESKFTYISGQPVVTGIPNMVSAELNVSGIVPNVVNANTIIAVCIDLEHNIPEDLDIFLVSPSGQILELSTDNGSSSANPNTYPNTCFTSTATNPISSATVPFSGTYQPEGNFSSLNGSSINGVWTLQVTDDATFGVDGILNNWSISFNNTHSFAYNWTPTTGLSCTNCPNPTATPTTGTTYIVDINDNFGCMKSDTVTIGVIEQLAAPIVNCGNLTGTSIQITWAAIPNAVNYEVNINNAGWILANGFLNHTLTGLAPSQTVNFQVRAVQGTVCDDNNGVGTVQCTTLPCSQVIMLDSTHATSCYGGSDGIAFVNTTGSQPSLSFTLLGGGTQPTGTFSNLAAGNYKVFATDGFNCVDTISLTISQPDSMTFTPVITNNNCFGESNGSISINVTGGTAPYSYTWSNGNSTTNVLSNLPIGNYTVTITDANNCQKSETYTITQPTDIILTTSKTDVLCHGGSSGTASVIAIGGVGNYSYDWNSSPVQTTDLATNLSIGTYKVIVTDGNGCLDSTTTTINQPTPLTTSTSAEDASCFGFNDGVATVTIGGGTSGYTYNWSTNPSQDSSTAINLTAGTYYVTATDANGCTIFDTTIINQPTEILLSFTTTQVTCFGLSDGSATVSATGGVGSVYTYVWNTVPTQNLPTATNLAGGTFEVTVTDSTNCAVSDTIFVFAPVILNLNTLSSTPVSCYAGSDGTVNIQASGGSGGISYVWNTSPLSNGAAQTNLTSRQYVVTATDAQGCQLIDSILVQQPDSLQATFVVDSLTCFQSNDGTATVSVIGGTSNFTYLWSNGQTTTQATGLSSGFAIVTITDANNCILIDSVFIPEPLLVTTIMSSTQVSCNGNADGTATAMPSGGTMPYTYLWSNTETTQTVANLSGGIIHLTITDSYGCTGEDSILVLEQPALTTTDTMFQISCTGSGDGTAIALPQGGTGIYSYQWQGLTATTDTIPNLAGGMYYYTITDSDNCIVSDSILVVEPTLLLSNITGTPVSCFGDINGTATATPSGGTAPYFYNWSTSVANAASVFSLPPGYTYVTITDLYNCEITDSILIGEPTPVTATSTHTPTLCFGSADGTATATPLGGVGNYTYNWIGQNQTTQTATGLAVGDYIVEVADSNGCSAFDTVTVTQPTAVGILPSIGNTSCFGYNDGAIGVTPVGGAGNYSYQWSSNPNDTLSVITMLFAGTYSVIVTDGNGCILQDTFMVTQPNEIIYSMGTTLVNCTYGSDGTAFIDVTGGTAPYNYNWNPTAANSDSITGLPYGNYAVTVTDNLGCTISDTILVDEPSPIDLNLSQQPTSCNGVADGEAYVSIIGGTPGYSILWNNTPNGVTDSIAYLVGNRNYIVTITDANGCIAIDSIFVIEPDVLTAQVIVTDETCFTADDGIASAAVNGGTPPFTYNWGTNANNQTTQTASNLASGVYTVLISDLNNCNTQATGILNQPDSLEARFEIQNILCYGESSGQAIGIGVGGVGSYTYSWQTNNGLQIGDTANNLTANTPIILTITDANGCEVTDQVTLSEPNAPISATTATDDVDCFGDEDGRIEVTTIGGTAPYTYVLNNNSSTTANVFIGLDAGDYEVIIEDANGCTLLQQTTIIQPDEIIVNLGTDILLNDGDNALLEPEITNGIAPFIYVWQPADSLLSCADCLNPVVSNITFDKRYDFIVTDANGCTGEDFIVIRTQKVKDIFVANAFTPNDDGNNDALYVQGNPYVANVKTFRVFDRWGELVYEVTDVNPNDESVGWDGKFKNQAMNSGSFVWFAEIEFEDGDVRVYQGSVMLIR